MSGDFTQSFFTNDDARQIDVTRKQHRAQIVRRCFSVHRNYFRQMRRDLIRESLDIRSGRKRNDTHASVTQRLDYAQTITTDGSG
jgi:hypothetical protein